MLVYFRNQTINHEFNFRINSTFIFINVLFYLNIFSCMKEKLVVKD